MHLSLFKYEFDWVTLAENCQQKHKKSLIQLSLNNVVLKF